MKYKEPKRLKDNKCQHGVSGLCCACRYGEMGWRQSKKGMQVEMDCVDYMNNKVIKKESYGYEE